MKKLLIVVPRLIGHGQERVAAKTAELLQKDYNIVFVIFDSAEIAYHPPVKLVDLQFPGSPSRIGKVKTALLRARALHRLKREEKADFTLSFGRTANLANVLSGGPGKILCNIRGFADVDGGRMLKFICRRSDTVICCAKEMRRALLQVRPELEGKTACLYNPCDVSQLKRLGEEPVTDYHFSGNTIVTHGRLEEVKNYPRLIKAFSIVKSQVPDAQLLIIGEGSQREKLEGLVRAYGLQDSVTMPGFRENPFAYLAKSSLYVLSSYSEGFPNALVEGMTFLPVVSVDCKSGPREILSDGPCDWECLEVEEADYGILVRAASDKVWHEEITEDDEVLAKGMILLLKDPSKQAFMQSSAAARVADFSNDSYIRNLKELLV